MFVVCSTGTRPLGQAIFGTWTRHSTPGHMPNLRAAGRLMPVAQASDGVPLCLLGKRSRIALNPEPRQFLRFFDFEAETIETRSLRHGAALPAQPARRESARRALGRGTRRLAAAFQVRLDPMGRHDEQGAPGTASLLQTGSDGPPTCRATARTFWLTAVVG